MRSEEAGQGMSGQRAGARGEGRRGKESVGGRPRLPRSSTSTTPITTVGEIRWSTDC